METLVHEWEYEGWIITFTWMGDMDVPLTRVYALAFTDEDQMLLVGDFRGEGEYWLPGGGIEDGESPEVALRRELMEEAAATVSALERIGVQGVHDPRHGSEHHGFYWCQISLDPEFKPETEVTERRLVESTEFLDQLSWGRADPKAAILLEKALARKAHHMANTRNP